MAPAFAADDRAYMRLANAELCGEFVLVGFADAISLSDGKHVNCRQFGAAVAFTLAWQASLVDAVAHVVRACSEKQVARIITGAIVASMEHVKFVWNLAVRQQPGHTMRRLYAVEPEVSVSEPAQKPNPRPALIGTASVDLGPEALRNWPFHWVILP